jgi:hypothetical protein
MGVGGQEGLGTSHNLAPAFSGDLLVHSALT